MCINQELVFVYIVSSSLFAITSSQSTHDSFSFAFKALPDLSISISFFHFLRRSTSFCANSEISLSFVSLYSLFKIAVILVHLVLRLSLSSVTIFSTTS